MQWENVSRDNREMLLAVDVGNTQTHLGAFEGERLAEHWRFQTRSGATGDSDPRTVAGGDHRGVRDRAAEVGHERIALGDVFDRPLTDGTAP